MITPDERIPQDDQQNADKDDQRSQQDVHSNGFDQPDAADLNDGEIDESDALARAYEATEKSHELNLDDEPNKGEE